MSKIVNKPDITDIREINIRRAAIEHRAKWAAAFYLTAKEEGIDLEPIMRKAVRKIGLQSGEEELKKFPNGVSAGEYGRYFCTRDLHETFEKKIEQDGEDEFICSLNYCPLLNAWQKMGLDDETCAMLCEVAMEGDRGMAEGMGFDFEMRTSLARGDKNCILWYKSKK